MGRHGADDYLTAFVKPPSWVPLPYLALCVWGGGHESDRHVESRESDSRVSPTVRQGGGLVNGAASLGKVQ